MKGLLEINRTQGGRQEKDGRTIRLRIVDDSSHAAFIDVELTPHDLAIALTGSPVDCEFTLRALDVVGRVSESKTEIVPYKQGGKFRAHDPRALAALEVDGWKARESDLTNHHHWTDEGIRVVFFRHTGKGILST